MTLNPDLRSRHLSMKGILAGWVVGLVTTLTLLALGTAITALTGITLSGVGIAAAIWSAIAALVGAYVAGLTAVRASAPATHNADGIAAMTHDDATLTGLVTAGIIILLGSLLAFNTARGVVGTATNLVGGVLGTAATATAVTGAGAAQTDGVQSFFGNISQEDVAAVIADNNANLNREQVNAAASVVSGIVRRAQYDLGDQDLTNVTDFAQARAESIKRALSGQQFVTRLEREGLSNAQAQEVQTELNRQVTRMEQQAERAARIAEDTARTAASNAAWAWLLSAGLTILATIAGARSAATEGARRVVTTTETTRR